MGIGNSDYCVISPAEADGRHPSWAHQQDTFNRKTQNTTFLSLVREFLRPLESRARNTLQRSVHADETAP